MVWLSKYYELQLLFSFIHFKGARTEHFNGLLVSTKLPLDATQQATIFCQNIWRQNLILWVWHQSRMETHIGLIACLTIPVNLWAEPFKTPASSYRIHYISMRLFASFLCSEPHIFLCFMKFKIQQPSEHSEILREYLIYLIYIDIYMSSVFVLIWPLEFAHIARIRIPTPEPT